MKKNSSTRSAFINPRTLISFALLFMGALLALFAFGGAFSQKFAALPPSRGGGGPVSKSSGGPTRGTPQAQTTTAYSGPRKDLRPVSGVRTAPLRNLPAIPPRLAPAPVEREPIRPQPPTDVTGPDFKAQTFAGALVSAPTPTGVSFEGVGAGIPGFVISLIPPDTNGRVGATQYVQWNNASFAIWDKTGKLLYGPVAGNTLFQPLGGACATHNDGDPVVAYDILSGR